MLQHCVSGWNVYIFHDVFVYHGRTCLLLVYIVNLLTMLCYQSSSSAKPSRLSHVFCPCYTLCSSADYAMIPKCIFRSHSCLCWVSVARVISTHHTRRCVDSIWGPPVLTNAHCHCHSRRTLTLQTYCYYSEEAETQHSNAGGIYTFSRTSFFVLCTTTVSTFSLTAVFSLQMALSEKFQDAVLGTAVHISSLDIDKRYPGLHAERLETKNGTSVLTIRESTG